MNNISCIIAAYNEAPRIGNVLSVVCSHPEISEVIVVDDGSHDNTAEIVRTFPNTTLIVQSKNMGKSTAIYTGINASKHPILILIDADLVGLSHEAISKLLYPVTSNQSDVSISLRGNTSFLWKIIGLDYISGERVLPRSLFEGTMLEKIPQLPGFGLEIFQNSYIIKNNYRIAVVSWPDVSSPWPFKKQSLWRGIQTFIRMNRQIIQTVGIFGPLQQIWHMSKLKKNYA